MIFYGRYFIWDFVFFCYKLMRLFFICNFELNFCFEVEIKDNELVLFLKYVERIYIYII